MKSLNMIKWDLKFQAKYGFYLLYAVLSVIYIIVLSAIPSEWRENTARILIFSDPSALGLFFMGAIVLLEKSQRIPCAIAISPVTPSVYIFSKVISLGTVSVIVSLIIAVFSHADNLYLILVGTVLSSIMFTLAGLIIATKITSLNQFIIYTVPIEIIGFVPAIVYLVTDSKGIFKFYPANICMDLISGNAISLPEIIILILFIVVLFLFSKKCVQKMWKKMGGAKL